MSTMKLLRILLVPLGIVGIICIWLYIFLGFSLEQANDTVSEILEL